MKIHIFEDNRNLYLVKKEGFILQRVAVQKKLSASIS
jgi:hypothetical protein